MTLQATATKMAQHVMEKANIPQQRKAIFVYGCELTLSTSASVLSIILLSIVLGALYSSFVFLAVFMGIRFFAGGYHAKTYSHCFLLTNFIYIISFLLSKYVLAPLSWPVKLILLLSSAIVVLVLAPIRHKKRKRQLQKRSRQKGTGTQERWLFPFSCKRKVTAKKDGEKTPRETNPHWAP